MSRKSDSGPFFLIAAAILVIAPAVARTNPIAAERDAVSALVLQIQKADYEDDREPLQHLYGELAPFTESKDLASRVLYWRGFALWRKALNGFNDSPTPKDLEEDLNGAVTDFNDSLAQDPTFV